MTVTFRMKLSLLSLSTMVQAKGDLQREVSTYLITYIVKASSSSAGAATEASQGPPTHNDVDQRQVQFSTHGEPLAEPPVKEDYVALAVRAAEVALRTTLGLSATDRIPDMPSSTTPTSAPNHVMHANASSQQGTAPASIPVEAITPPISPMSEQDATELEPPARDSTAIDHPLPSSGPTKLDDKMALKTESQPEISKVESVAKEESGNSQAALPNEMKESSQPAKADPEA